MEEKKQLVRMVEQLALTPAQGLTVTGPQRIQCRRDCPWQTVPKAIQCGRGKDVPGHWGNPSRVGEDGTASECVAKFVALYDNPLARARLRKALAGKTLAC